MTLLKKQIPPLFRLDFQHLLVRLGWGCLLLMGWWVLISFFPDAQPVSNLILFLFLMAPCVVVPLGLLTFFYGSPWIRWCLKWEWVAALLCVVSLTLAPGSVSGALALPWAAVTFCLAGEGLRRLGLQGFESLAELALSAGLLFCAVGGVWLVIARFGLNPMNFGWAIVFLTAVHFHFAGFASMVILGATGRWVSLTGPVRFIYRTAVIFSILGIPLLALGISFSPLLEVSAACVFVVGLLLWSGLILGHVLTQYHHGLTKGLLAFSALTILMSMAWALVYAFGEISGQVWVTIPQMGWRHGLFNVFGFALPAFMAFALEPPLSRLPEKHIPWSQIWGHRFIGPDFFQRRQLLDENRAPQGLMDDIQVYARGDFDPGLLPDNTVRFYEHTQDYELCVTPQWRPGFRWAGHLFRHVMDTLGQMALPIEAEDPNLKVESRILPIDSDKDGRQAVRAWVRVFKDTGKVAYAAAYSWHTTAKQTYMNIAFPFPGCHLTSVLRLDHLPHNKQVLSLSSLPLNHEGGDQGIYLVFPWFFLRLPINETIRVFVPQDKPDGFGAVPENTTLLAEHQMWILGLHCLTLHYAIYPDSQK